MPIFLDIKHFTIEGFIVAPFLTDYWSSQMDVYLGVMDILKENDTSQLSSSLVRSIQLF
jgi:hypothetical protein